MGNVVSVFVVITISTAAATVIVGGDGDLAAVLTKLPS